MATFKRLAVLNHDLIDGNDNIVKYLPNADAGHPTGLDSDGEWVGYNPSGSDWTVKSMGGSGVSWIAPSPHTPGELLNASASRYFCNPGSNQGGLGVSTDAGVSNEFGYTIGSENLNSETNTQIGTKIASGGALTYFNGKNRGSSGDTSDYMSNAGMRRYVLTAGIAQGELMKVATVPENAAPTVEGEALSSDNHNHDGDYLPAEQSFLDRYFTTLDYADDDDDDYYDEAYAQVFEVSLVGVFGSGDLNNWVVYGVWEGVGNTKPVVLDQRQKFWLTNAADDSRDMINVAGSIKTFQNFIAIDPSSASWGSGTPADSATGDTLFKIKGFQYLNYSQHFDGTGSFGTDIHIEGNLSLGNGSAIFSRDDDGTLSSWNADVVVEDANQLLNMANLETVLGSNATTEDTIDSATGGNFMSFLVHNGEDTVGAGFNVYGGTRSANHAKASQHTIWGTNDDSLGCIVSFSEPGKEDRYLTIHSTEAMADDNKVPLGGTYVDSDGHLMMRTA